MSASTEMSGRVALVTGSSRGIGRETSRLLAANGASVVINGREQSAVDEAVASIRSEGGRAIGIVADCTSLEEIERMRLQVEEELGPVDILAPFVGGYGEPMAVEAISEEKWRFVIDANLTSMFLTIHSFLPGMIERKRGSIVTMASSAGRLASMASAAYAAAKGGVVMFSKHLARELGHHGIRVNCVAPSAIMNSRMQNMPEEQRQKIADLFPLGRIGVPDDVAQATLFLASERASWLTGVTLDIAGGRIIV